MAQSTIHLTRSGLYTPRALFDYLLTFSIVDHTVKCSDTFRNCHLYQSRAFEQSLRYAQEHNRLGSQFFKSNILGNGREVESFQINLNAAVLPYSDNILEIFTHL